MHTTPPPPPTHTEKHIQKYNHTISILRKITATTTTTKWKQIILITLTAAQFPSKWNPTKSKSRSTLWINGAHGACWCQLHTISTLPGSSWQVVLAKCWWIHVTNTVHPLKQVCVQCDHIIRELVNVNFIIVRLATWQNICSKQKDHYTATPGVSSGQWKLWLQGSSLEACRTCSVQQPSCRGLEFPIDWPTWRRYHFHFCDCPEGNKYHLILGEAEGAINWPVVWGWRLPRPAPGGWLPTAPGAPWPWPWGRCGLGTCPWAVCACAWWGCGGPALTHDAWGPLTASRLCACNTCTFTSHHSFFWHRCLSLLITAVGNLSLFIWVKSESMLVEMSCSAHPTDTFQRLHVTLFLVLSKHKYKILIWRFSFPFKVFWSNKR